MSPSVATVRTSRGARKKRRMISSSHAAPSATAAAKPGPERDEPREPRGDDDHHRQRRGDVAEVGLGEVEDPVGAVHERHADADHRGEQADEHAPQRDARRDREGDHAGTAGSGRRGRASGRCDGRGPPRGRPPALPLRTLTSVRRSPLCAAEPSNPSRWSRGHPALWGGRGSPSRTRSRPRVKNGQATSNERTSTPASTAWGGGAPHDVQVEVRGAAVT